MILFWYYICISVNVVVEQQKDYWCNYRAAPLCICIRIDIIASGTIQHLHRWPFRYSESASMIISLLNICTSVDADVKLHLLVIVSMTFSLLNIYISANVDFYPLFLFFVSKTNNVRVNGHKHFTFITIEMLA